MSMTQAAWQAEKAVGHGDNAVTQQDVSDYSKTGDGAETMKALTWQGVNKVEMCMFPFYHNPKHMAKKLHS